MAYRVERRIFTLVDNAVMKDGQLAAAFAIQTMKFSHWDNAGLDAICDQFTRTVREIGW